MSIVKLRGVTKTYSSGSNGVVAVNNVSFDVAQGDFITIVGQSGSGKTTLLNMIGCIDRPTLGSIEIDSDDVMAMTDKQLSELRRKKIGYIFQNFNLIPILSAEENIMMPSLLNSRKADKAYISELAELLEIKDRLTHLPGELSGGQKQRVAIARALINRPDIILADEPTGNLDKATSGEIIELLRKINKLGNTVLLVTHNEEFANLSNRKIRISDGSAVEE